MTLTLVRQCPISNLSVFFIYYNVFKFYFLDQFLFELSCKKHTHIETHTHRRAQRLTSTHICDLQKHNYNEHMLTQAYFAKTATGVYQCFICLLFLLLFDQIVNISKVEKDSLYLFLLEGENGYKNAVCLPIKAIFHFWYIISFVYSTTVSNHCRRIEISSISLAIRIFYLFIY